MSIGPALFPTFILLFFFTIVICVVAETFDERPSAGDPQSDGESPACIDEVTALF